MRTLMRSAALAAFVLLVPVLLAAQVDPALYSGLRYRMIGPFRGGRTIAVSGIEGQPNTYYFGAVAGGVWKSTNGGETWEPIFDSQPIASIGALAIAPSNPNIIYVGTGEADFRSNITYGNGVYKSTDGGKTWNNIGLRATRQISRIVIDPRNPNLVLVAALGHAYGPNPDRGIFRSTDGGASWQKVLYKDENTGAIDITFDPDNPQTLFAALWSARRPPWSVYPPNSSGGAIYKSTDSGAKWTPITGGGLPTSDLGRIGLAVARGSKGKRVYALIDAKEEKDRGLYRSDDSAATWTKVSSDPRISGRGWYFGEIDVDPKNPDVIYSLNVSIYRSTDGGKNFTAIKGAPGGDDYHTLWIDPTNPQRMINGSDQGVGASVDGGKSWSSWYNQPTAQIYHVAVDNQFPYHVYGAQQDSGSVDTTSRGNDGSITFRDWHPAGMGESGYIVPDPADPNILYGGGTYGELYRYDKRTGQSEDISPDAIRTFGDISRAKLRFTWTSPLAFSSSKPSSKAPRALYFGSQFLLKSTDQGKSWQPVSPDLTGADPNASREGPTTVANARARGYGVIYTIAPSPLDSEQIWVGSDSGLIHFTRDGGKTWSNVTPPLSPDGKPWSKISMIEPSHFDTETAYVALDRHRMDDLAPYFCRTSRVVDIERRWDCNSNGIPDGAYLRVVREDPSRQGLLFAGTELGVYFSIDDGDHWQPLQLNMPVVPVHDLVIKDNDLVVATHGRSFWILDDITPLRQLREAASARTYLFKPATAMRIRKSTNHDTPLSPEVPAGENPPHGAVFYYYLKFSVQTPVTLEILDSAGKLVRRYSSADTPAPPPVATAPFPAYWFRETPSLSAAAGMHRFIWDLRYAQPQIAQPGFSMSTVVGQNVPTEPEGAQAVPGDYQVRLTVAGQTFTQPFHLAMDPRVTATADDLQKQFTLETELAHALAEANAATQQIHSARAAGHITEDVEKKLVGTGDSAGAPQRGLTQVSGTLAHLLNIVDSADTAPTSQESEAATQTIAQLKELLRQTDAAVPGGQKTEKKP